MSFVKIRCPHCDAEHDLDRQTCDKCGKSLRQVVASKVEQVVPLKAVKKGAGGLTVTLLVASTGFALLGMLSLSEATMGVGMVAFGIWLGVMGRISQAGDHYFRN